MLANIPVAQMVKNLPANAGGTGLIPGLGRSPEIGSGNPLQIFAWRIPWTWKPGGLQSMGLQRVGHDWATNTSTFRTAFIYLKMFSSVAQSSPTLCDPVNHSSPGLPVHHQLPKFTQTHVHWVSDAIQPSHPLLSPSPPAPNPSKHQGLFQWVNSSHEAAKVLEFQLQHQSFQWISRSDLL